MGPRQAHALDDKAAPKRPSNASADPFHSDDIWTSHPMTRLDHTIRNIRMRLLAVSPPKRIQWLVAFRCHFQNTAQNRKPSKLAKRL